MKTNVEKSPRVEELVKKTKVAPELNLDKNLHWRVLLAQIKKMLKGRNILLRRQLIWHYTVNAENKQRKRIEQLVTDSLKSLIDNGYVKEGFGVVDEKCGICLVLLKDLGRSEPDVEKKCTDTPNFENL